MGSVIKIYVDLLGFVCDPKRVLPVELPRRAPQGNSGPEGAPPEAPEFRPGCNRLPEPEKRRAEQVRDTTKTPTLRDGLPRRLLVRFLLGSYSLFPYFYKCIYIARIQAGLR